MTKKSVTPEELSQALAMREAGYTVLSISQKSGISVRSLQRHFARHGTRKGVVKEEILKAARNDLMEYILSDDAIRQETAKLVNDDLAHAKHIREIMLQAAEELKAISLKDAVLVMRAAAAYSTALKNTSDMLRHILRTDKVAELVEQENLPELVVSEISASEASRMRQGQRKSVAAPIGEEDREEVLEASQSAENDVLEEG